MNAERPDGDAPDRRGRRGDDLGDVEHSPRDDSAPRRVARRRRAIATRTRTARRRRRATAMSTPAAAQLAIHASGAPGQPAHRELSRDRAHDRTDEAREPELSQHGTAERAATVDRRQEHVPHLGGLECDRSSSTARPQAGRERKRRDEPDGRGTVLPHALDPTRGELVVADQARQEEHDDRADDAGDVGVVRSVEPVDFGDLLPTAGAAQVAHRLHRLVDRDRRRHRRATLATVPARFRTGRHRAVGIGAPPRPRCDEEPCGRQPGDLDGQHVDARRDARAAIGDQGVSRARRLPPPGAL